jgi:hypothetical protein
LQQHRLSDVADCVAGRRRSLLRPTSAMLVWSHCSSPPAPTSLPRTSTGRALCRTQLRHTVGYCWWMRGRWTALTSASANGHLRGRGAHRRRRRRRRQNRRRVRAVYRTQPLSDVVVYFVAGGQRSWMRRPTATCASSHCSSPPVPTSPPRTT